MLDTVLFDLDGTISDPADGITGAFRHAVSSVGHDAPDDMDLRWIIGPAVRDNLARYGLPDDLHDEVVRTFRAHMTEIGLFRATLHAGMVEVIDALRTDGVRIGLATAKPKDQAETTLTHLDLTDRFDAVAGGISDGKPRSKALIVGDALSDLGSPDPSRVAMVGDRLHDIEGAKANGCTSVAVTWGYAEVGELDHHQPDHRVDTPAELLDVLRSL